MRHPSYEPRRRKELLDGLLARARAWIADWQPRDEGDFATALFAIAARLESEVTQRLDRAPEKAFRGFLDWLGVTGRPGLAARLPVVFRMAPGSDPVDAPDRIQLQINTGDTPVNFETELPLRVLPGTLATIIAADPKRDAFFTPPADIFAAEPPAPMPRSWRLKSEAVAGTTLQLDPPLGLEPGLTLRDPSGRQYDVTDAQGGIVTIDPPLAAPLNEGDEMKRVDQFTPFGATAQNRQEHALYIGSDSGLNIDAEAEIAVGGGAEIPVDAQWAYSGKRSANGPVEWIPFDANDVRVQGGRLVLHKPAGAIETHKIDGRQSRWLRALRAPGFTQANDLRALRLFINCLGDDEWDKVKPVTAVEGIANTTPLVLDAAFYPLGREPRQFDSFYLGSKEVFSKSSAKAHLEFTLGDTVTGARASFTTGAASAFSVGITDDGRLQRILHNLTAAGEPTARFLTPSQASGDDHKPVKLAGGVRPGALSHLGVGYASAASGAEVWLWRQIGPEDEWTSIGRPNAPPIGPPLTVSETMLTRAGMEVAAYAISDKKLFRRILFGADWVKEQTGSDPIVKVVPVMSIDALAGEQDESDGVIAVTEAGGLLRRRANGTWTAQAAPWLLDTSFYPLIVRAGTVTRCVARDKNQLAVALDLVGGNKQYTSSVFVSGTQASFAQTSSAHFNAVFVAAPAGEAPRLMVWDAFNNAPDPFDAPASPRRLGEGPAYVGKSGGTRYYFCPGDSGEAYVISIKKLPYVAAATLTDALLLTDAMTDWTTVTATDLLVDLTPTNLAKTVVRVQSIHRGSAADSYVFKLTAPTEQSSAAIPVVIYTAGHSDVRTGTRTTNTKKLQLVATDAEAGAGLRMYLESSDGRQRILEIDSVSTTKVATFLQQLPGTTGDVNYQTVDSPTVTHTVEVRPFLDISGLDPTVAGTLANATLAFPGLSPATQLVREVLTADKLAVLSSPWSTTPASQPVAFFVITGLFGTWFAFEPPAPRNPELSWEYFDGTAWRLLPRLTDTTDHLAKAGTVDFCVPGDLQETDIVGRKNHWIRARLVGGDYGQESVTVISEPVPPNKTKQTIERDTDDIRAPYVAQLTVKYQLCCAITPEYVLTRDNGGLRDQTDANRNAASIVDYFIPLSTALTQVAHNDGSVDATNRALYLGFDTKLVGGPIQVLFLVNDGSHDEAFPLRVDALVAGGLRPLVVKDNTRGLNESGTIEMHLAESPQLTELFGTTKYWLRLRPGPRLSSEDTWRPSIRAAYLNATWATAAETQRFEQLGSSDGSPDQRFVLTRPPVIEGSLKLRVLERLGDEDIAALRRVGVDIQDTFPNFPDRRGCWVLWKQVVDPADEPPGARVYALDDATGVIRFGDGLHGMIPPIGANVILAEEYRRGGGEAANRVTAWSQINLVTPLSGVNAVFAPEGAAGGSDPQDADTTMRFAPANLRLRERALTLADFEMLTLQFSRDIAQARALHTATGLRLVVIMRGRSARPGVGLLRELRTYLLSHALPHIAGKDVLRIEAPEEIPVRIALELVVADIASGGDVARSAGQAMERLLDPAIGGHEGVGFALGESPSDTDITAALVGIRHLEGIGSVTVTRADGSPLGTLTPSQLVRLAPDGVIVDVRLETEVPA